MRAKGDSCVSKRRQFVVSKRRLGDQKETNEDALLCGLPVLVRFGVSSGRGGDLVATRPGCCLEACRQWIVWVCRLGMPLPFQAPKRKIPGGLGDSVPQVLRSSFCGFSPFPLLSSFANYKGRICLLLKTTRQLLCYVLTCIFGLPRCPHAMEPKAMAAQPGSVSCISGTAGRGTWA